MMFFKKNTSSDLIYPGCHSTWLKIFFAAFCGIESVFFSDVTFGPRGNRTRSAGKTSFFFWQKFYL